MNQQQAPVRSSPTTVLDVLTAVDGGPGPRLPQGQRLYSRSRPLSRSSPAGSRAAFRALLTDHLPGQTFPAPADHAGGPRPARAGSCRPGPAGARDCPGRRPWARRRERARRAGARRAPGAERDEPGFGARLPRLGLAAPAVARKKRSTVRSVDPGPRASRMNAGRAGSTESPVCRRVSRLAQAAMLRRDEACRRAAPSCRWRCGGGEPAERHRRRTRWQSSARLSNP